MKLDEIIRVIFPRHRLSTYNFARPLVFLIWIAVTLVVCVSLAPELGAHKSEHSMKTSGEPRVSYFIHTKNGKTQFRLGERIVIEEKFSSSSPGEFAYNGDPWALKGGFDTEVEMSPVAYTIDHHFGVLPPDITSTLKAQCKFPSITVSGTPICSDCSGSTPITNDGIERNFALNYDFTLSQPGHYLITARTGRVFRTGLHVGKARAIPIVSNSIAIDVIRDDEWAHAKLIELVQQFEEAQKQYAATAQQGIPGSAQQKEDSLDRFRAGEEMFMAAQEIRFLDSEESLKVAVEHYDGMTDIAGRGNDFYQAITETAHLQLASRLLEKRICDPDFYVTDTFLKLLVAITIEGEHPEGEWADEEALRLELNPRAIELLRRYLLAMGESLPSKAPKARETSLDAFLSLAHIDLCNGQSILSKAEIQMVLDSIKPNASKN